MTYLDTSVLVSYYTPETRSADANRIVTRAEDAFTSVIGAAEFYVTIARKVREKVMTRTDANKVIDLFEVHFGYESGRRTALNEGHVNRVKALSARPGVSLRTLDALHLAFAEDLGAVLATFDSRLAEAAKSCGIEVIS